MGLLEQHPLYELLQRNTFQLTTYIFIVMSALALVGIGGQKLKLASGFRGSMQVIVQEMPVSVIRGGRRVLEVLFLVTRWLGGLLGVTALALPFFLDWMIGKVYQLHGEVMPAIMVDAVASLEEGLLFRLVLYFVAGLVWFWAIMKIADESDKNSGKVFPLLALVAASLGLIALLVWQFRDFWQFFWPADQIGQGEGYLLFNFSVSGSDLPVMLMSQVYLAPLYIFALSTFIVPALFFAYIFIPYIAKRSEAESSALIKRVIGPLLAAPSVILASILLTIVAVGIGNARADADAFMLSPVFVLVNAAGDGLTLLMTAWIVGRIYKRVRTEVLGKSPFHAIWPALMVALYSLPLIFLDLAFSALLAVVTVVISVDTTGTSYSLREVLYILVGLSKSGAHWEMGGLFFAMHTTFAPTFVFLASLALSLVLLPLLLVRIVYGQLLAAAEWFVFVLDIFNLILIPGVSLGLGYEFAKWLFVDLTQGARFELAHELVGRVMQVF